jgi:hypothetical protein
VRYVLLWRRKTPAEKVKTKEPTAVTLPFELVTKCRSNSYLPCYFSDLSWYGKSFFIFPFNLECTLTYYDSSVLIEALETEKE